MAYRTLLFDTHIALGARMTVFNGWEMPLHYGSQIEEHHRVRRDAGVFDISHLGRLDVYGAQARSFLRQMLANDVDRLPPGKALYSCLLNQDGGILDDLLVFERNGNGYRLVGNAATRQRSLDWLQSHSRNLDLVVQLRDDLALLAVQGPQAVACLGNVLDPDTAAAVQRLAPLHYLERGDLFISRTGYTGEDGVEVMLPADQARAFWDRLLAAGVWPCGLGARDTLRLEAGLNLYGAEMNEATSPLTCGLDWTVAWEPPERDFIGRSALKRQRREGIRQRRAGLVLGERGVLRPQQRVIAPSGATGLVTSGTFSPSLGRSIALARVPSDIGFRCQVDVRHKYLPAWVVEPPFVWQGRCLIDLPADEL